MVKPSPRLQGLALQLDAPARSRKQPKQARSMALVDALKQSGREILEKEGHDALTGQRLAERSGVAISSIYEYFPTMASLVAVLLDDDRRAMHARLVHDITELPPSARLFDGLLLMMRAFVSIQRTWCRLAPDLHARHIAFDELVRLDLVQSDHLPPARAVSALVDRFHDEVTVHNREKALFLAGHALQALTRMMALEHAAYLDDGDTPVLIARMLHALLSTVAPTAPQVAVD